MERTARGRGRGTGPRGSPESGFTLVEMLTTVALLIIMLGLMVSLAWSVRRQSSERLTKGLLLKLDALMTQYVAHHKQLPEVTPLVDTSRAATQAVEADLPDEETLLSAAELNNRDFVLALRSGQDLDEGRLAGPVLARESMNLALAKLPIDIGESLHAREGLAHSPHREERSAGRSHDVRRRAVCRRAHRTTARYAGLAAPAAAVNCGSFPTRCSAVRKAMAMIVVVGL